MTQREDSTSQSWEVILVVGVEDGLSASSSTAVAAAATAVSSASTVTASTGTTSWGSSLSVLELVFLGGSETEKLSTGASGDGVSVGRGDLGGEHLGALLLFVLVGETLHVGLLDGSSLGSWEVGRLLLGFVVIEGESDFFLRLLLLWGVSLGTSFGGSVAVVSSSVSVVLTGWLSLGLFAISGFWLLLLIFAPSIAATVSAVVSSSAASSGLSVVWVVTLSCLALVALSVSTGLSTVDGNWVSVFIDSVSSVASASLGAAITSSASLAVASSTATASTAFSASAFTLFVTTSAATVLSWVGSVAVSVLLLVSDISELTLTIINLWLVLLGLNSDLLGLLGGSLGSLLDLLGWGGAGLWSWSECSKSVAFFYIAKKLGYLVSNFHRNISSHFGVLTRHLAF